MPIRRILFLVLLSVVAAVVFRVLVEALIGFAAAKAYTPPAWWPDLWDSKTAYVASWWQFTHLLATALAAVPVAMVLALFAKREAMVLAFLVTFAAVGAEFAWQASDTIGQLSAAPLQLSALLELAKFLLLLPALTWLVRLGLRARGPLPRFAAPGH